jgi:site-specific recombinase XerD
MQADFKSDFYEPLLEDYKVYLAEKHKYRKVTITNNVSSARSFLSYLLRKGLSPLSVTKDDLISFAQVSSPIGNKQNALLLVTRARQFMRFLAFKKKVLPNASTRITKLLSESEIETLINLSPIDQPLGIRDRAFFSLVFIEGFRFREVLKLNLNHVDLQNNTVLIEISDGAFVPITISKQTSKYLSKYITEVRPFLYPDTDSLFISKLGHKISQKAMWLRFHQIVSHSEMNISVRTISQIMNDKIF